MGNYSHLSSPVSGLLVKERSNISRLIHIIPPPDPLPLSFYCVRLYFLFLTLKVLNKNCILIFYFYLLKKIRLDFSCESSTLQRILFRQRIHLKHQVLLFLKNNETIFMNVVCCSRDWRFKGYNSLSSACASCGNLCTAEVFRSVVDSYRQYEHAGL